MIQHTEENINKYKEMIKELIEVMKKYNGEIGLCRDDKYIWMTIENGNPDGTSISISDTTILGDSIDLIRPDGAFAYNYKTETETKLL